MNGRWRLDTMRVCGKCGSPNVVQNANVPLNEEVTEESIERFPQYDCLECRADYVVDVVGVKESKLTYLEDDKTFIDTFNKTFKCSTCKELLKECNCE